MSAVCKEKRVCFFLYKTSSPTHTQHTDLSLLSLSLQSASPPSSSPPPLHHRHHFTTVIITTAIITTTLSLYYLSNRSVSTLSLTDLSRRRWGFRRWRWGFRRWRRRGGDDDDGCGAGMVVAEQWWWWQSRGGDDDDDGGGAVVVVVAEQGWRWRWCQEEVNLCLEKLTSHLFPKKRLGRG
ncbi:hypothetical protein Hanom_Chr12g01153241 [Helianthus anomalus]